MYDESLLAKPSMILVNKMDSEGALEKFEEMRHHLKHMKGTSEFF